MFRIPAGLTPPLAWNLKTTIQDANYRRDASWFASPSGGFGVVRRCGSTSIALGTEPMPMIKSWLMQNKARLGSTPSVKP